MKKQMFVLTPTEMCNAIVSYLAATRRIDENIKDWNVWITVKHDGAAHLTVEPKE